MEKCPIENQEKGHYFEYFVKITYGSVQKISNAKFYHFDPPSHLVTHRNAHVRLRNAHVRLRNAEVSEPPPKHALY